MCGIAGIVGVGLDPADARSRAGRMADILVHRGPDAGGLWYGGAAVLAHRRLRIIDVSERGAQPMASGDGRYVLVYNGEIYNYRELRESLRAEGVEFHSESDTEVLVELFARRGEAMLDEMNGIFAFAIWDRERAELFAARDPFGVKPFYYGREDGQFLFASEIKALLEAGCSARPDKSRVTEYLLFGETAGECTLFQKIRRLPPGSWLRLRAGEAPRITRYFDPFTPRSSPRRSEAVRAVRESLDRAVDRQMVSDVPVGAMCSGGLDSSGLTALSAARAPAIDTFCVRIEGPRYDETGYSRLVSDFVGTSHHVLTCRESDVAALLPTMIWLHDEPLKHANSVAIFQISRLAKEHVTVLLSGEGADEVFGGYSSHRRARIVHRIAQLAPRWLLSRAAARAERAGRSGLSRMLRAAGDPDAANRLLWMRAAAAPELVAEVVVDFGLDLRDRSRLASAAWDGAAGDAAQAAMYYDQLVYLPTLLDRQDKMCMGASIESRVPFLDVDVARLANSLGSRHKVTRTRDKAVLRDAFADSLPESIHRRDKYAFGIPIRDWLRADGVLSERVGRLATGTLVAEGVVRGDAVRAVVERARAGDPAVTYLVWHLLNLELWWELFVSRSARPDSVQLPAWRQRGCTGHAVPRPAAAGIGGH